MNLTDLPIPVLISDREGNILSKNGIISKKKTFAGRRSVMTLLNANQKLRYLSMFAQKDNTGCNCEVFCFQAGRELLASFVMTKDDTAVWFFPETLARSRMIPWQEFKPRGINDIFVSAVNYVLRFPNITLPALWSKMTDYLIFDINDRDIIPLDMFAEISSLAFRVIFSDDKLILQDNLPVNAYFYGTQSHRAALHSLGKLACLFSSNDASLTASLSTQNGKAQFVTSSVPPKIIKIGSLTEKRAEQVGIIKPYFYGISNAVSALALCCTYDLVIK